MNFGRKSEKHAEPKKDDPFFKMDDYFSFNILVLKCVSMWPLKGTGKKVIPTVLFFAYAIFVHVTIFQMFLILIFDTMDRWSGDIAEIAFIAANVIAYGTSVYTLIFFHARMPALTKFSRKMNEKLRLRSAIGMDFVTLEKGYRIGRKLSILWTSCTMAGCQYLTLYPFLINKRVLPMASTHVYPYDANQSPYYGLTFLLQGVCQFLIVLTYCGLGTFYMVVVLMLCGQYDMLFCSLKNVYHTARLDKGMSQTEARQMQEDYLKQEPEANEYYLATPIVEDLSSYPNGFQAIIPEDIRNGSSKEQALHNLKTFSLRSVGEYVNLNSILSSNEVLKMNDNYLTELDQNLNRALMDCVKHHLMIMDFCKEFKKLYSPMIFIKILQVTTFLGVCAYGASGTDMDGVRIFNIVEYLCLSTSDLFIYCSCGHQLYYQSERVRLALLRAPWHRFGGSVRRSMNIILQASSAPIILTGGGFYNMNLAQFRTLLSASFSYFTLLRNMQK